MQSHFNPHLHQQLVSFLSTASSSSSSSSSSNGDDTCRVAALESIHRAILYPPNSLLLPHSAPLLSQGLSRLLSDKSYAVRRAAAVAYGSLCAILASTPISSNGLQNHVLTDHFIAWALPQLGDIGGRNGSAELALESLREFLSTGNASSIERYTPTILKACQELLEDERTSPSLLHLLLRILTLISMKFWHCFQLHFVDIVDVLLGWAFMPDLSESDRCTITDSFLQFQNHWLSNLNFSLGLLSKFLEDMEVLIQDASLEVTQQRGRLLALFSCFSTILQVTASGMLEIKLLEQIREPIESMAPRFLRFILMFGRKYGWSKWVGVSWRCLSVLADILQEKFADCYLVTIDILFQSLNEVSSSKQLDLIKSNRQLLSMQKLGLSSSAVQILLQFETPLSQMRLHPNHLIVANTASTYLFLLQHDSDSVVSQAVTSLVTELELLKGSLQKVHQLAVDSNGFKKNSENNDHLETYMMSCKSYSEMELISLFKFDLKLLLCSVSIGAAKSVPNQKKVESIRSKRSTRITSFILKMLDPFDVPIKFYPELQVHVISTLHKLSEVEDTTLSHCEETTMCSSLGNENEGSLATKNIDSALSTYYLRKYNICIIRALDVSSSFSVKMEALKWILDIGRMVLDLDKDRDLSEPSADANISGGLLLSILDAAYDREINVRSHVSSVLEVLLDARLIYPGHFCIIAEVALDKLTDLDIQIKNAFVRVLSIALPLTLYTCSSVENREWFIKLGTATTRKGYHLNWKQVLALKQLPQKLNSQQLVSILSYISQRSKVPSSNWIQRLVFNCLGRKDISAGIHEAVEEYSSDGILKDPELESAMMEKMFTVNNMAAIWWSIHESARHCISLRLRTHLGGPTQTFAALERMLLDVPNVLLLDTEQSESNYIGSSSFHLLPMRLLLEFVEALKKNVYNAYEGSSVLPCPTRQSSLFFRANKKVCEEWFSRICEPLINAGLALDCHDATLHNCALRLQDLRTMVVSIFKEKVHSATENFRTLRPKLAADVLKILRHASLALCRNYEPDALLGLQKWVMTAFPYLFADNNMASQGLTAGNRHLSWMTGLVYQAQGYYEKAAAHFSHLLQSEEALSSMGSDGIQFIISRVIESYTSLSDWKSLDIWLTELQVLRSLHAGRAYSGALTAAGNELNAVHALASFDEGDVEAAWGYLDLTPKSSNELTLDPKLALERSEQMLLRSMLQRDGRADKVTEYLGKAKLMLEEILSAAPLDGLTEAAACATQLHCIFAFEEGMRSNGKAEAKQVPSIMGSLQQVLPSIISSHYQDCSSWLKIFRVYRTVQPDSLATPLLCEKVLYLARKQNNFSLAERMRKYLTDHLARYSYGDYSETLSLNLQYESILLQHSEGKHEDALVDLWSLVRSAVISSKTCAYEAESVLKAKACLKLSTWLRQDISDFSLKKFLLTIFEDFSVSDAFDASFSDSFSLADGKLNPLSKCDATIEEIVGITTKVACHLCPTMGKAWLSYASWCFNQAKGLLPVPGAILKSCSLSPALNPEVSPDRFQLTEEEISMVKDLITKICYVNRYALLNDNPDLALSDTSSGPKDEALVSALVQQTIYLMEAAAGAPGLEESDGDCPSSSLSSQLQTLFLSADADSKKIDIMPYVDELIKVWWSYRQRRVSLLGHAAKGYFSYLSYSFSKLQDSYCANTYSDATMEKATSSSLRAMLYILHILLNYGVELRDTLEVGFATVPLLPWQEITAQLFARLSTHPKETVRKQLEGLLMMLAKLSPWSIVYPLLVDINACEGSPSEELKRILDCLGKLNGKLVQDVQLAVNCLGTITVLWEEQWLSTLQDLHNDVLRRINLLKEEAARIAENTTLSHIEKNKINAAKYSAMMAPIIVALERRLASTSREPETPHETWFSKEYGRQLKAAILAFKNPPVSSASLGDVWRSFNAIAASLANSQRRSYINLSEVAPQLALLSSSNIPMPGLEKQISVHSPGMCTSDVQGIITVSSFSEQIAVLSTKTKPKKLILLGSDGEKYTYLLKGREDLRLDARIMQLLQAINSFLKSGEDTRVRSLVIRYYSVTPINGQAGLIQWVDNVTSIYSVYKAWLIRTQRAQSDSIGAGITNNSLPPVPRPSDMFYGKIIPALKEKGIRRVISRRDWPHEVKRKVLLDLMKDTPKQLLWQELWCASEGFRGFSLKAKRFSGSVAAMSIVGHILGLGDRHLDNILMDFYSGDVIHIDHNICFDKGKRLKIPEIVPFRLTQTIETALGLTGVEGTFRSNCEAVVDILRKNKDIVLMLLGVFLWDPLMEWTRDNHDEATIGGEEKKGMELAVSLSLFASRFQEIRIPLQEHHDLLVSTLPFAESTLKRFFEVLSQYEVVSAIFYHADEERACFLQQETSAKSILAEVTSVVEKSREAFEVQLHEYAQAKSVAIERAQEAAMWVDQHGRILDALRSGSIPDSHAYMKLSGVEDALSLTSAVVVSGVPLTIVPEPTQAQCYDVDREVRHLISELVDGVSCAVEALHEYGIALQRILPLNYITTSPVSSWAKVLQLSVNNISTDVLSLARRQASDLIVKAKGDRMSSVQHIHQDLLNKVELYATEIEKLEKECSELSNSIGPDTELKSKERVLSSFTQQIRSIGYSKEDVISNTQTSQGKHGGISDPRMLSHDEKKLRSLSVLHMAANELYKEVENKILNISNTFTGGIGWQAGEFSFSPDSGNFFREFEAQIEKCVLVAGFVSEAQELVNVDFSNMNVMGDSVIHIYSGEWAPIFMASLHSCKYLIEQMADVLPQIVRSMISYGSDVMEAFGSLSQVRGSIDTALEKLAEVEQERASLMELENNYFAKVAVITEKQLGLQEASAKGREHLSWEEAEELASQEEACRIELEQLHQAWNKKDMQNTSLKKIESNIKTSLMSTEQYFSSLISMGDGELQIRRSKAVLSSLLKPFGELESVDKMLSSYNNIPSCSDEVSPGLSGLITSDSQVSESLWGPSDILKDHTFFIWKVTVLDTILDACIHDVSSSVDHNSSFDQVYNDLRKKITVYLQEYIVQYLKKRIAPALLAQLQEGSENLKKSIELRRDLFSDQIKRDSGVIRRLQLMLEEYCNVHETARATRSAILVMKRQVTELTDILCKTAMEIAQMEWLHDTSLPHLLGDRVFSQNVLNDDKFSSLVLTVGRPKLLEKIQSSMTSIGKSLEYLQACEITSISAEGQLERAMGWACGGPNTGNSSVKSSGIPSEFHDHLLKRRQILWTAREQATTIIKICTSLMEFEASRDGLFRMPEDQISGRPTGDGRTWQDVYLNALTRLDVAYHSFTCAEQEWKLAQSRMEAASAALVSATKGLHAVSSRANSASGDMQDSLAAMYESAYEAGIALSAYTRVSKGHTALTTECGSMLEEVLAIAEGLHDVYSLGKEASTLHTALMQDLSKANAILLPIEASLATDIAAIGAAIPKERENNADISPIYGQQLHKSYCSRVREACISLKTLVPPIIYSVKELHSMLTKLARSSSLNAGNLHKALEGLGDSQSVSSQDVAISRPKFSEKDLFDDNEQNFFGENGSSDLNPADGFCLRDEEWISPPEHTYTSSPDSGITSAEASFSENSVMVEQLHLGINSADCHKHLSGPNTVGLTIATKSESQMLKDEDVSSYAISVLSDQSEEKQPFPLTQEAVEVCRDSSEASTEKGTSEHADILGDKNDRSSKEMKNEDGSHEEPSHIDTTRKIMKGKNPYALSVLRQVELKIDGRDVDNSRFVKSSEQVDLLLKQATSIDNLCNMYEGWTPWI